MHTQKAYKIGKAYRVGLIAGLMSRGMAADKARWITVHPNGKGPKADGKGNKKGLHAQIDDTTGTVLRGMGGKFNGMTLSQVKAASKKARKAAAGRGVHTTTSKVNPAPVKTSTPVATMMPVVGGLSLASAPTATEDTPVPANFESLERDWDGDLIMPEETQTKLHADTKFQPGTETAEAAESVLKDYTGAGYKDINNALRSGDSLDSDTFPEEIKEQVETIDAYLNEHKTTEPMQVFRGINAEEAQRMLETGEYQDKGYSSTSTSMGRSSVFAKPSSQVDDGKTKIVFALNVPKGYGAVSLRDNDRFMFASEREILLERGAHGKISHVEKIKSGKITKYVAYVDLDPRV